MVFVKNEKKRFQVDNLKKERANVCGLFWKSYDQKNRFMVEKMLKEEIEKKSNRLLFDLFWKADSKHLFIGEGDLPFDKACLLRFTDTNDLINFLESPILNKLQEFFKNNGDKLEIMVLKERPLPKVLKLLIVIFKALGKLIPFSKFKGQKKNDFENFGGINPRLDQINSFKDSKLEGPYHMINFLSFKGKQGFKDYQKYGLVALRGVIFLGGRLAFIGQVINDTEDEWNQLAIMEYPTIDSFMNLVHMPGYAKATFWRAKGLLKTLLVISKPSNKS